MTDTALGVVAGGGTLPAAVLQAAEAQGRRTFTIAINGECDPATVAGRAHAWLDIAAVGGVIENLRQNDCGEVVMAGRIGRPDFARLRPDWQGIKLLPRVIRAAGQGDDALLKTLVAYFEEQGFRVIGADQVAAGLLASAGVLGRVRPGDADKADIARAIAAARELGRLDVGQAAVVRDGQVLDVEAADGTDALLARCAGLNGAGRGGVLVKLVKPGQERRVDLPTIGVRTINNVHAARLAGVAVEAGSALILDRAGVVAAADAAGLFLFGFDGAEFPA